MRHAVSPLCGVSLSGATVSDPALRHAPVAQRHEGRLVGLREVRTACNVCDVCNGQATKADLQRMRGRS